MGRSPLYKLILWKIVQKDTGRKTDRGPAARTAGRQQGKAKCEPLCEPAGGSVESVDDHTLGIVMTGVPSLASTDLKQNILSNINKREWREERRGEGRGGERMEDKGKE